MNKQRMIVRIAWLLCVIVILNSLFNLALLITENPLHYRPLQLAGEGLFTILPILMAVPGALILLHNHKNVIGWLMLVPALYSVAASLINRYLDTFVSSPPPPTFINIVLILLVSIDWVALIFPLFLIPLLFPNGKPPTPRWRWLIFLAVMMIVTLVIYVGGAKQISMEQFPWTFNNPKGLFANNSDQLFLPVWSVFLFVITVSSFASIFVRYRQANAIEREQIKFLLYASTMFLLIYAPGVIVGGINIPGSQTLSDLLNIFFALSVLAFPVAIAAAILRYRLFEIDVIIRLTLIYAILTGILGLLFVGSIILLQSIFTRLFGQTSDIAIVVTTLLTIALFNPLRLRIQSLIDRRFYRQKYNAEQAIAELVSAARTDTDLESITGMLVEIIQKTLQPDQIQLYLLKRTTTGRENEEQYEAVGGTGNSTISG